MTTNVLPQATPTERRTEHPHVTRVDSVLNGVPILRGTRIPVRLIAQMYREGDSIDDILHGYPQLSAAAVHDALSYYLDHRTEIEQEIIVNRVENVAARKGATIDERGFVTFAVQKLHSE